MIVKKENHRKVGILNMFDIIKQANKVSAYLTEYIADKEADIKQLPTHIAPGSKCIVIESGNTYYLNCSHQWTKSQSSGGGGGSGDEWEDMNGSGSSSSGSSDNWEEM